MAASHGGKKTFREQAQTAFRRGILSALFLGVMRGDGLVAEEVAPPVIPEISLDEAKARTPAGEVCAANANRQEMEQNTPRLAADMDLLDRLPLTGKALHDMLADPANGMRSCIFPVPPREKSISVYIGNTARIASSSGTSISFHEYFHAWQDVNGGAGAFFKLTPKDAAIDNLLQEASAVAYELAARREAENRGLSFYDPPTIRETREDGSVSLWYFKRGIADDQNAAAFHAAYGQSWEQNASADAETRKAKALEAGGRAVVRRLLEGRDEVWKSFYVSKILENVNKNMHVLRTIDGQAPGYAAARDEAFKKMGAVSANINFIPEEYLGSGAVQQIDRCFEAMGLTFEKPVENPPENPPGKTAGAAGSPRPPA